MRKRTMMVTGDYLHIPIQSDGPRHEIQIWIGDRLWHQFAVALASETALAYCFFDVKALHGCAIDIVATAEAGVSQQMLDRITAGNAPEDSPLYPGLYGEDLRPQFHFSSRRGWLNDPNGLFWHDGLYHLYYQHDPFGTLHQDVNIGWGHATSRDLVHWEEQRDAIMPWRRDWLVASGSALVDKDGVAGYGKGAVLAVFTCLGAANEQGAVALAGGQHMAVSLDDGWTFRRFSQHPMIPVPNGVDWRDPSIFQDGDLFYIAVYERREDVNGVSFYASKNLRHWEFSSWSPHLYECPDVFRLTAEETGTEKWVLYGADGMARLGDFTEGRFLDEGISFPLDYGISTYAGQTWCHQPDDRRIHISWVRGMDDHTIWAQDMGYPDMPFSQCMSLPCEIALHEINGHFHLCRAPVPALDTLRTGACQEEQICFDGEYCLDLQTGTDMTLDFSLFSGMLEVHIGRHILQVDGASGKVQTAQWPQRQLMDPQIHMRILVDRTTVELFLNSEISATYAIDTKATRLLLRGTGRFQLSTWKVQSIWGNFAAYSASNLSASQTEIPIC